MPGFVSSLSNSNDAVFAKNADFSLSSDPSSQNGLITDGQLWIGHTDANINAQHVFVGNIVAGTGITVGYSSPNITVASTAATTDLHVAKLIVNSSGTSGTGANFSTLASAMTAAVSGDTIFVMPGATGVYTENVTLKSGVNICAFDCDALTPNVTIAGTLTHNTAGTVSISGIRLQTNGAASLVVSGSAASIVNVKNCYLNCTNATGIQQLSTNGASSISVDNSKGNITAAGIAIYNANSNGNLNFEYCDFDNSGGSTQPNSALSGFVFIRKSTFFNPTTTSGSNNFTAETSAFATEGLGVTALTLGGSGSQEINICGLSANSVAALTSNTGSGSIYNSTIKSDATNAIDGSGTLRYSNITFNGLSSIISTTTQLPVYTNHGKYKAPGQPAFSAFLGSADNNVTGDGTDYTIGTNVPWSTFFDTTGGAFNTNGIFTAPERGKYHFIGQVRMANLSAAMTLGFSAFVIGPHTYFFNDCNCGIARSVATLANLYSFNHSMIVEMNAGEVCSFHINILGGTKTAGIAGSGVPFFTTLFQGFQIA